MESDTTNLLDQLDSDSSVLHSTDWPCSCDTDLDPPELDSNSFESDSAYSPDQSHSDSPNPSHFDLSALSYDSYLKVTFLIHKILIRWTRIQVISIQLFILIHLHYMLIHPHDLGLLHVPDSDFATLYSKNDHNDNDEHPQYLQVKSGNDAEPNAKVNDCIELEGDNVDQGIEINSLLSIQEIAEQDDFDRGVGINPLLPIEESEEEHDFEQGVAIKPLLPIQESEEQQDFEYDVAINSLLPIQESKEQHDFEQGVTINHFLPIQESEKQHDFEQDIAINPLLPIQKSEEQHDFEQDVAIKT